jgi:hypothetical protein
MKLIHFKDDGQDFTEWVVGDDNVVIESQPFQTGVWKGYVIMDDLNKVKTGDHIYISGKNSLEVSILKHAVVSVEDRPGVPDDYTCVATARGYEVKFKGQPVFGAGILDSARGPRGKAIQKQIKDYSRQAWVDIHAIIMGRDKTHDKILYQYAADPKAGSHAA